MAIAEAEPKKNEVAVTSAGVSDGMKEKALNGGKNFAENQSYASSSTSASVGTVRRYNLYDSIKGFRFEMPDGWNDEDIALFVTCCWEKKDDFVKSNGDRTKIWADIARSGAKQSKNPSLFTINSCLALAERIRYYVSKNSSIFLGNEAFMKFHSDVKGLLPYFSDNFDSKQVIETKCIRRKSKSKPMAEYTSELLSNDSALGDVIHNLALENAEAIRSGNCNVWNEMAIKLEEHLGLNPDVKTILESEKNKIISSVARMEEKGIDKKTAFIECARGFIEIFDYISPENVKVSDYLDSSVGSSADPVLQGKDKSNSKLKRSNYYRLSENDNRVENGNDEEGKKSKRSRLPKGRKVRSRIIENKLDSDTEDVINDQQEVVVEPSSTTSIDEASYKQHYKDGKEKNRKLLASHENMEKTVNKNNTKNSGRLKEEKISPRRILPPRTARSKVISYCLNPRKAKAISSRIIDGSTSKGNSQQNYRLSVDKQSDMVVAKNSSKFGDFDTDNEENTFDFTDRFRRTRGTKSISVSTSNVNNPDTTTKEDLDDKMNDKEVPFVKRLNRKRVINKKQEELGSKVRIVNTDCKIKDLVVKLVDCNGSIDNPSHLNSIKQEKRIPFNNRIRPDRSKEVRLIEESAVLAKDVVDSEYNPSSDSAKLVSDEHLNSSQLTKHHISPFFDFSNHQKDDVRVSADSSEDIEGPLKMALFHNNKLQDNSVSSPYSASAGSSWFDGNQMPSTSSGFVNSTTTEKVALESALATLKKCRKELLSPQDNGLCVSTSEVFENNQLLSRMEDAPLPDWFAKYVADFRKREAWKMQQVFKVQQDLMDVEHRKIMLLEKILESLAKE